MPMRITSDPESALLTLALVLGLLAYLLRRRGFDQKGKLAEGKDLLLDGALKGVLGERKNIFLLAAGAWTLLFLYILVTVLQDTKDFYQGDHFWIDCALLLGLPYLVWHERLCWLKGEDYPGLAFINGVFFLAMTPFILASSVAPLEGAIVYFSSYQTAAFLTMLGYPVESSVVDFAGNDGFLRVNDLYISTEILMKGQGDLVIDINLTCSGFPSHVIFFALALASRKDVRTKATALLAIPLVHFLNILRMMFLVFVIYEDKLGYFTAHDVISRGAALIALFVIFAWFFRLLPDVHKDFLSAMEIHKKHRLKPKKRIPQDTPPGSGSA